MTAEKPPYRQDANRRLDTDTEWLYAMFVVPERELAQLPTWALPVVTPPRPEDER